MPRYFMISNRNITRDTLGPSHAGLSYWTNQSGPIDQLPSWNKLSQIEFQRHLLEITRKFPLLPLDQHEQQRHITLFIHGYNNTWSDAALQYENLCRSLYPDDDQTLGVCILFAWPSDGMFTNYLPDRVDAHRSAPDLAQILSGLYDWLLRRQTEGAKDPARSCRAKTSVIAHSMGNFLLQKAMHLTWTRKNQPLLLSLINQLLMVAADVDNDLFNIASNKNTSDGYAVANLAYRATALYTGRDSVLGLSSNLKHFGKRRLGRTGLDNTAPTPDNVWDADCSPLFTLSQTNIHSAYFSEPKTINLMRDVLRGLDRGVLQQLHLQPTPVMPGAYPHPIE